MLMSLCGLIRLFLPLKDVAGFDAAEGLALAFIPPVNTGEDFKGWMKPEIWAGTETTWVEQGLLTGEKGFEQVYTMQFVEEIYPR